MKKLALVLMFAGTLFSCSDDDDDVIDDGFQGETKEYALNAVSDSGVDGVAIFTENEDGSTTIEIELDGTEEGGMHPAHIHVGNTTDDGAIAISLEDVDGDTGTSTTEVSELDNGEEITFEELKTFDGYINVHLSADELETIVAQGDIGDNELTDESVTYNLDEVGDSGISGTALFEERANGETRVTISLEGTPEGGSHPAHIHMGSVEEAPGGIAITFNPIDGDTGMSVTNIDAFDDTDEGDGEAVTYEDLLAYDGYINVHLSAEDLETIVAQGNMGANASE